MSAAELVREEVERRLAVVPDEPTASEPTRPAPGDAAEPAQIEPQRPRWLRMPELVEVIRSRAAEPWVTLTLGRAVDGAEIARVRAGGMVVMMGPTGAGKTSLVVGVLIAHARERGPVVVLSRELPADELAARAIGMQCDASWEAVMTDGVPLAEMERAAALPRMVVLERRDATLAGLVAAIQAMQAEHPGETVLVAVDYIQIIESGERETRAKVADVIAQIDDIARAFRVVVIAISQMSRASSRAARAGEAIGADSTDAGAESAAIERAATVTLSIGATGPEREDGTRAVDLNIGKGRMGGGDRVLPMDYTGRSGRWRITGEARPAAEVKAQKQTAAQSAKTKTLALAIPSLLDRAANPMSRRDLRAELGGKDADVRAAVAQLLTEPEASGSDVVQVGPKVGGAWLLWTRRRADAAGRLVADEAVRP